MKRFMKKYKFGVVALIAVIAFASFGNGKSKTIKGSGVLSVKDVQSDPSAYKGTVTITGVVAGASRQDQSVFAIIETSEAILCKTTGCASFYLPVKYEGVIPKQWDEVNVTGSFTQTGRVPLFTATKVEVLKNLFRR